MNDTPNLALPYILASQAQKHVTHNEAIRALDCLVQLSVLDRDLAAPPGSPAEGDRFIVAASPTGAWAGQAGRVAAYQDGAWNFYTPRAGWAAWIADEAITAVYDAGAWANEIEADKVQNAQLADMAATTLKGNNSASPANPSDLTVPQVKSMLALLASDISGLGSAATSAASDFDATGAASSAMSAHLAASDPHSQYHTDARGDARYDASGAASSAMSAHLAASDPHTQYHTDARGDARYDASGAATSAMSAHLAASDPHTQYHTDARGDARYMPVAPSTVGINATADTTNRLALKSPASLFDNDGAGHQQKINKASAGDTASQLYQTGYSGRAEIGLSGDDDFHLKVSPDGSTWFEGITIDRTTGRVDLPSTGIGRNRVINPSGQFAQAGLASTTDGAYSGFNQ